MTSFGPSTFLPIELVHAARIEMGLVGLADADAR